MRVKRGVTARKKHKKLLQQTKGMQGLRRSSVKKAREAVYKAASYAYRDRRNRKRDFRGVWISRIGAGARLEGLTYSELTHRLKMSGIEIDRKILADLAVREPEVFKAIVKQIAGVARKSE
jgi:large subunit ribosomal protein L20